MSATRRTATPALRAVRGSSNALGTLLSSSSLSPSPSLVSSSSITTDSSTERSYCFTTESIMTNQKSILVQVPKNVRPHALTTTCRRHRHTSASSSGLSYYISSLRNSALEMLTSDLAPEERTNLLSRLDAVDASEAQKVEQKSIGEAVAEAVQQEARRNATLWEREKETIAQQAEKAAADRVMSDLAVQRRMLGLEQWKKELQQQEQREKEEEQRRKVNGESSSSSSPPPSLESTSPQLSDEIKSGLENEEDSTRDHHPILGPVILDLGYKRIHVSSAKNLASIPVWERQRVYRHERAKVMATEKRKSLGLGLPGIITLHEAENGQLSILDGQHRVGMMAILQNKTSSSSKGSGDIVEALNLDRVLVEVFPDQSESESSSKAATANLASDVFTEINKAEPVKLVDMPGVAKKSDRRIIDEAASMLRESYEDMFKPSQRCRAPHLNVDNLRDALFAADILKRHTIRSHHDLLIWIEERNEEMRIAYVGNGDGSEEGDSTKKTVSKTALNKAIKYDFFLGLDSSWLYK